MRSYYLCVVCLLQAAFCASEYVDEMGMAQSGPSWNYNQHGNDWTGTCATGTRQSPVDITADFCKPLIAAGESELKVTEKLVFSYGPITKFDMANNGHTLQITPKDDSRNFVRITEANGQTKDFALKQLHFHRLSEHLMHGSKRYGMEIHLVHASIKENDDALAVVGYLLDESEGSTTSKIQTFLDSIMSHGVPPTTGSVTIDTAGDKQKALDLKAAFGTAKAKDNTYGHFYRYAGSLTTPPCTEIVTWFVADEPLKVDLAKFMFLPQHGHQPDTYRSPQNSKNKNTLAAYVGGKAIPSGASSLLHHNSRSVLWLLIIFGVVSGGMTAV